jgi:GNAT superfamily N-acetyltransferase
VGTSGPILRVRAPLTDAQLNALFAAAWPHYTDRAFGPIHLRSLTWISAWRDDRLVGYVNVATDGGVHAFLLDTTVHPAEQRRGLGRRLVRAAAREVAEAGATWLHVDFEPHLEGFYRGCGFAPTTAGLLLTQVDDVAAEGPERRGYEFEVRDAERDADDRDALGDAREDVREGQPPAGDDHPHDVGRTGDHAGLRAADDRAAERP